MLPAIQRYLRSAARQRRTVLRSGPFLVCLDPSSPSPHASYAIPDAGAEPTPADAAALLGVFVATDRRPRLGCVPSLATAVEPVLLAPGVAAEARPALMPCAPRGPAFVPAARS